MATAEQYFRRTHARVLRSLQGRGAAVRFSAGVTGGVYDPQTDTWSGGQVVAVEGIAVEVPGDLQEYEALEVIGKGATTLTFVPTTFGQAPGKGSAVQWAGRTRTVRAVRPVQPAGQAIAARVVLV